MACEGERISVVHIYNGVHIIDGSFLRLIFCRGVAIRHNFLRAGVSNHRRPLYIVKCAVARFLVTGLNTEIDAVALVYRHSLCRGIMRRGIAFGNRLTPQFGTTFLNGHPYTVGLLVFLRIIITGRNNQRDSARNVYNTLFGSHPNPDHILHRRRRYHFSLFRRVYGDDGSINLAAIYDRTWRIGTAECECRHGIALCVKLDVVEINLAI